MEGVLLQESLLDDVRGLQKHALSVGKSVGADELHDLLKLVLLLENAHGFFAHGGVVEFRHFLLPPGQNFRHVFAVRVVPVDGGEVAGRSKRFVESPESPDVASGVLRHGFREVAALGGNGAYYGNGAFPFLFAFALNYSAGSLVELRQTAAEVSREAFLRGHFLKSSADLAQSFLPAGSGVRHDGHMVAHVAVIFRNRDPGVDAGFAGRNGHVGSVGDQDRALDQRISALGVFEFREFLQDLRHLVAALATADVNDNVGVAPLGQLVLGDGLAGAETAGDGGGAASGDGEEKVYDALPGEEGHVRFKPSFAGPGMSYRPLLGQTQDRSVFQSANLVFYRIFPFRDQAHKLSLFVGRDHYLVDDQAALGNFS